MILLVTTSDDIHSDLVEEMLLGRNAHYFRFNTDRLADDYSIGCGISAGKFFAEISDQYDRKIVSVDIRSVWYRRVRVKPKLTLHGEYDIEEFTTNEYLGFIRNFLMSLSDARWMNNPKAVHFFQDYRMAQYMIALNAGLSVPDTLYTNEGEHIQRMFRRHKSLALKPIVKKHIKHRQSEDLTKIILTRKLEAQSFSPEQLAVSAKNTPVQLQSYIPKCCEIRLTVIGKTLLACRIDSQASDRTKEDWRRYDLSKVGHEIVFLPESVTARILKFMAEAALEFGAIDLIHTPDDKYVFLEINPAGNWHWIEKMTGLPIAKNIADWLIKNDELYR